MVEAERKAAWIAAHPERVQAATQRYWEKQHPATGPNEVACCGRHYFAEEPSHV